MEHAHNATAPEKAHAWQQHEAIAYAHLWPHAAASVRRRHHVRRKLMEPSLLCSPIMSTIVVFKAWGLVPISCSFCACRSPPERRGVSHFPMEVPPELKRGLAQNETAPTHAESTSSETAAGPVLERYLTHRTSKIKTDFRCGTLEKTRETETHTHKHTWKYTLIVCKSRPWTFTNNLCGVDTRDVMAERRKRSGSTGTLLQIGISLAANGMHMCCGYSSGDPRLTMPI